MTTRIKKFLQTNGKLEQSGVYTYAFNLPAVSTCPNAGACKAFCFASIEQKQYPQAMAHRDDSLALTESDSMFATIHNELLALGLKHLRTRSKHKKFAIRIHASGDFYSVGYILKWIAIMNANPNVQFYAYTKSVALFKRLPVALPANFRLIYSLGGTLDSMIDVENDRHARIFSTEQEVFDAGYELASEDDTVAWQTTSNKIGLVIFGARRKQFNKAS